jgi:hypothetical protein
MKSSIFWDITPGIPLNTNRRFGGTCRFLPQGLFAELDTFLVLFYCLPYL